MAIRFTKNKYNNKRVEVDGIKFQSGKEAKRYSELKLLEKFGFISELKLQVKFILQKGFEREGKKIRPIIYLADFVYMNNEENKLTVEDSKGFRNPVYTLKKKMFLYSFPDYEFIES